MAETDGPQRIDKWLVYARVVKSRGLAAKLASSGRIRVNSNKIDQASHSVRPGDVLTITLDRQIKVLKVVGSGERRGPFAEAQLLYEDLTPAKTKEVVIEAKTPKREPGAGRPTKRDRRQMDRFR